MLKMIGQDIIKATFEKGRVFQHDHCQFELRFKKQDWKDYFANAPIGTEFKITAHTQTDMLGNMDEI